MSAEERRVVDERVKGRSGVETYSEATSRTAAHRRAARSPSSAWRPDPVPRPRPNAAPWRPSSSARRERRRPICSVATGGLEGPRQDSLTGLRSPSCARRAGQPDVGAGALLPRLVLAARLSPGGQIDLIESERRRDRLHHERRRSRRKHPERHRVTARAEDVAQGDSRRPTTSSPSESRRPPLDPRRAGASPLLRPNGVLIAWKGKRDQEEEQQLENASEALAMAPERVLT